MQAGCGGGYGAGITGIDRLVARFVFAFGIMGDVGRERQVAVLFDQRVEVAVARQFKGEKLRLLAGATGNGQREGVFNDDPTAGLGRLAGTDLGQVSRFMIYTLCVFAGDVHGSPEKVEPCALSASAVRVS